MDIHELEQLAALVQKANIRELTLKQGDARITIRKSAPETNVSSGALVPSVHGSLAGSLSREMTEVGLDLDALDAALDASEQETAWIAAPLVGVFKHVKPVVGLGARVTPGQVVGIIEAVKLMHEITSEVEGVVTEALAEDGMPVEYDQPLFEIKTDS